MEITDIKCRKSFADGMLAAIYSVTFDNQLAVHDIKLIRKDHDFLVVMPSRKTPTGEFKDIVHPINCEFREKFAAELVNFHNATQETE
ncbi:MAG: SpoVG family protein [Clostridia bacterium]